MKNDSIPPETVRALLDYDPATGVLRWRKRTAIQFTSLSLQKPEHSCAIWNAKYAGKIALTADNGHGYFYGKMIGYRVQAHRLAWAHYYGYWPRGEIDHINHKRKDNRITNLRDATKRENARNASKATNNTSETTGVMWLKHRNKWQARIKIDRTHRNLGCFTLKEDAIQARKNAEWAYGFHENHGK